MKIVVTGANGQVGWDAVRSFSVMGDVIACDRKSIDLSLPEKIASALDELKPDVIVNAGAYTAVDDAETEEAVANKINCDAVGEIGRWARRNDALAVHFSTDYVFNGMSSAAYSETDRTAPLNAYGRSKLKGEIALAAEARDWLTFRTTWVYAPRGKNFFLTVLRLARERENLKIVGDQFGAPTSSRVVSDLTAHAVLRAMAERKTGTFQSGLFHVTTMGVTTWHGFATAIINGAKLRAPETVKLITREVTAITTEEYPLPAIRPANSALDCSKFDARFQLHRPHWTTAMDLAIDEVYGVGLPPPKNIRS